MIPPPKQAAHRAFSLLELMTALAVFLLLAAGVFVLVAGTSQLFEDVARHQDRSSLREKFVESLRVNFEELPAEARLEFDYVAAGSTYHTYLSIIDAPRAFDFGFDEFDEVERVLIAAEIQSDGFIRAGLYYLSADQFRSASERGFSRIEGPFVELIPRLRQLSWQFFDEGAGVWRQTLEGDYRHSLVEMKVRFPEDSEPHRHVFWHPEFR